MGKYLKMADVLCCDGVSIRLEQKRLIECDGILTANCIDENVARYVSHAINSHDDLVAEVERLRGENEALMKCRMAAREFFNATVASGGSVKVSSASKSALDEADKASDWLEAELKDTADLVNK